jgi:RNA polymerase primary sigma factor
VRKAIVSYEVPVGTDDVVASLSDLLSDESEADAEALSMEGALKDSVRGLLETLAERERYVVKRRYGLDGEGQASLAEIGMSMGITRERVRQVQRGALLKLRSRATVEGLESFLELSNTLAK